MRKSIAALVVVLSSLAASPAYAWGASAHRYIMRRAIALLPPPLKPFFDAHKDELVVRVNDPDLWRTAGWPDDPNHFVDFGVREYGPYPFVALPRDYDAAVEKFGVETLRRYGTLPWRAEEEFGNLRRAFEAFARGPFAASDAVLFSAVTAHYLQDAHQPFHAVDNYDGQMTGQNGIHSRFETALFERYEAKLDVTPPPPSPILDVRDFAFDTLLRSYQLVDPVLKADKAAAEGREEYDDVYFDRFFAAVKPVLEQRLGQSISATAGLIVGAWQKAGRPELKMVPRAPQKIRKSGVRNTTRAARGAPARRA